MMKILCNKKNKNVYITQMLCLHLLLTFYPVVFKLKIIGCSANH